MTTTQRNRAIKEMIIEKTQQRNGEIKKMLIEKTQNKSIRLVGGKGIAYGWVKISIDVQKPANCTCENEYSFYCNQCKQTMYNTRNNVESLVIQSFKEELDTYYSDDYANQTPHRSMFVDINLI